MRLLWLAILSEVLLTSISFSQTQNNTGFVSIAKTDGTSACYGWQLQSSTAPTDNGNGTCTINGGTVTSVTFTGDGIVDSSTPSTAVTTSGTLTATLNTQSANTVLAGPTSGGAVNPTFRALVGADLPNPSATTLGGIESLSSVSSKWINTISTSGVPSATQPAASDLSNGVTGSGAVVLQTSPTITTPIIAQIVPSADFSLSQNSVTPFYSVGSGAVANTFYLKGGNVGIGTTVPSGLLEVGTQKLDVLSGGNVGIGSITPGQLLDVQGTERSTNMIDTGLTALTPVIASSAKQLASGTYSGNTTELGTVSGALTSGNCIKSDANGNLIDAATTCGGSVTPGGGLNAIQYNNPVGTFAGKEQTFSFNGTNVGIGTTNGRQLFEITNGNVYINGGNLGIGTLTAGQALDVNGTIRTTTTGGLTFGTDNKAVIQPSATSGSALQFITNGSERMRILNNGSVGIGTYIVGGSFIVLKSGLNDDIAINDNAPGVEIAGVNDSGARINLNINAVPLLLNTNVSPGNVGIGSSNPGQRLDIGTGLIRTGQVSCANGLTSDASGTINGCAVSDQKLKTNIVNMPFVDIMKFTPRFYQWKDISRDDGISISTTGVIIPTTFPVTHAGFVAQEVATVFPQAIVPGGVGIGTTGATYNLEGIDANAMIAVTVQAIQDIKTQLGNGVTNTAITSCGCKVYTNGLCTTLGVCT